MRPILVLSALCLSACVRPLTSQSSDASSAPAPAALSDAVPDAGWLTPAKVDAWLRYHQRLLTRPDGGTLDLPQRARRERAVRLDAGLSEDEVDRIEDLVAAVVTARTLSRLTGGDALRDFEQATANLTPTQRAQAQKAMADLRAKTQQTSGFETERSRFGAEAVDAVMAREAEITKTWDWLVEAK